MPLLDDREALGFGFFVDLFSVVSAAALSSFFWTSEGVSHVSGVVVLRTLSKNIRKFH